MKKIVFILILSLGIMQNMNAQCEPYIQKIDSLIKNGEYYSLWSWGNKRGRYTPASECEQALLDYTERKGYYRDSNSTMIQNILSGLAWNAENKSVREDAINAYLDRCYAFDVSLPYLWKSEDFNRQAREHLKRFLRQQYTSDEIERYVKDFNKNLYKYHPLDSVAQYIAFENKQDFQYVKDSILNADYEKPRKWLSEEGYQIDIPLIMGWYHMHEMIPLLDSIWRADNDLSCAMALARMGNKECQEYFENGNRVYSNTAYYIGTQDMIYKYGKELYSKETRVYVSENPALRPGEMPKSIDYYNPKIPIAYNVIIDLQNNIINFPKLINRTIKIGSREELKRVPPGTLEKAQKWVEENKENYQIKKDFIPSFDISMFESYY